MIKDQICANKHLINEALGVENETLQLLPWILKCLAITSIREIKSANADLVRFG